jgi:mono/diheme cytochrome c family protein
MICRSASALIASIAAAGALLMALGCAHSSERERVDFERMRLQQRGDVYAASGAFPNGAVVQTPPDSTIPVEQAADIALAPANAASLVQSPVPATLEVITVGRQKFATYCAVCHGAGGFGGSIVALNMGTPRPPSLRRPAALAFPAGYIFTVATHGLGRMPAYAPQLTTGERWAVAAYVKRLQRTTFLDPAAAEDSARAVRIAKIDSIAAAEARK